MRAILQDAYDGFASLRLANIAKPAPRQGQVLVEVHAASVNADVWHMVCGRPRVVRLFGGGLRKPRNPTPGIDLAGTVSEVGNGVDRFSIGDEVYGEVVKIQWQNGGTYADYAVIDADRLELKPQRINLLQAGSVPSTGGIAYGVTIDEGGVADGHTVVVNGAGGGVGEFVVQLAKAQGATVTAVDRGDKFDRIRRLGADDCIDFTTDDFTAIGRRWDRIIDVATERPVAEYRRALRPGGRYVMVGHHGYDPDDKPWFGNLPGFLVKAAATPFIKEAPPLNVTRTERPLRHLTTLIDDGLIEVTVAHRFGLDDVAAAYDLLASGDAEGRIVIDMHA